MSGIDDETVAGILRATMGQYRRRMLYEAGRKCNVNEVLEEIPIHQATWYSYFSKKGTKYPSKENLDSICAFFDLTPETRSRIEACAEREKQERETQIEKKKSEAARDARELPEFSQLESNSGDFTELNVTDPNASRVADSIATEAGPAADQASDQAGFEASPIEFASFEQRITTTPESFGMALVALREQVASVQRGQESTVEVLQTILRLLKGDPDVVPAEPAPRQEPVVEQHAEPSLGEAKRPYEIPNINVLDVMSMANASIVTSEQVAHSGEQTNPDGELTSLRPNDDPYKDMIAPDIQKYMAEVVARDNDSQLPEGTES